MADEVWGLLGDLQFKAVDSPDSLSVSESEAFAEIPLIQSKPQTQWVGSNLRTLKMSFFFDFGWCNPSRKLTELQELLIAHEPLALSLGEGNYNGNYHLVGVEESVSKTLPSGELTELSVRVSLRETTDEPPSETGIDSETSVKVSPFEQVR